MRVNKLIRVTQYDNVCFRCNKDFMLPYDSIGKYAWLCNACQRELDTNYTEIFLYQEENNYD